jgi:hypothetical protein
MFDCFWKEKEKHHFHFLALFTPLINFALDVIAIRVMHVKLWAPKIMGVPLVGISKLPLGSPRTKCHLDVVPVESCREYYKGEGGGFPKV